MGGFFEVEKMREELSEFDKKMEAPNLWDDPEIAQKLMKKRGVILHKIEGWDSLKTKLQDVQTFRDLILETNDKSSIKEFKAELDEYIAGLRKIVEEAYENPDIVKSAPHRSVVHKIDHASLDDPERWAITWRAHLRKNKK